MVWLQREKILAQSGPEFVSKAEFLKNQEKGA